MSSVNFSSFIACFTFLLSSMIFSVCVGDCTSYYGYICMPIERFPSAFGHTRLLFRPTFSSRFRSIFMTLLWNRASGDGGFSSEFAKNTLRFYLFRYLLLGAGGSAANCSLMFLISCLIELTISLMLSTFCAFCESGMAKLSWSRPPE